MQRFSRTFTPIVGIGLMLASAVVVARSVPAQAASLASLSVNPTHGVPTDKFAATYQISPCQSAAGQAVSFYWDGVPPTGGKSLGQAFTDATCTALLAAVPPANAAPGNHTVWAFLPMNDGSPLIGTSASHGYMVDTPSAPAPASQPAAQPVGGGSASGQSAQTVTAGSGTTSAGSGGKATTSGASGTSGSQGSGPSSAGGGEGSGANQASGGGGGAFGPAPHIMTPLGLISQAFIGWSLLLLLILMALLLAVGYSQQKRASVRSTYP